MPLADMAREGAVAKSARATVGLLVKLRQQWERYRAGVTVTLGSHIIGVIQKVGAFAGEGHNNNNAEY